jgi:hypothetical protein
VRQPALQDFTGDKVDLVDDQPKLAAGIADEPLDPLVSASGNVTSIDDLEDDIRAVQAILQSRDLSVDEIRHVVLFSLGSGGRFGRWKGGGSGEDCRVDRADARGIFFLFDRFALGCNLCLVRLSISSAALVRL